MESRCEQFASDAKKPRGPHTCKEIDKLRKFLFKNQTHRFTEREQQQLFQAVQAYAGSYTSEPEPDSPAMPLVEDALKMPFTVFTTGQKKSMLKWLDRLQGLEAEAALGKGGAAGGQQHTHFVVLDVGQDLCEVMDESNGETERIELAVCDPALVADLREAFAEEREFAVALGVRHSKPAIVRLVER